MAVVLAGLALVIGLAVRLYDLGGPSLWLDEGFTYVVASGPLEEIPHATTQFERAPPLYYVVVHAFLAYSHSEAALRGASVLAGMLAIVGAVWLGWIAYGAEEGALAGLFLSISALHVMMSQDARNYAMAAVFVTLSSGLWLRELRAPGRVGNLALYCASAVLAVYTHYVCFACIGLQWLCGLAPFTRKVIVPRLCAAAGVVLLFLPWLPTMLSHGGRKTAGQAAWDSFPDALFVQAAGFFLNYRSLWVWYAMAALALLLMLLPLLWGRDVSSRLLVVVCGGTLSALILISIFFRMGIYNAKYLVLVSPLFWVLAARTTTLMRARGLRLASPLLLFALLLVNVVSTANLLLLDEWHKQDWRGAVAAVAAGASAGDLVLLEPAQAQATVDYYWRQRNIPAQLIGITPELAASVSEADLARPPRIWLVEGEGVMVDPEHRVARLLASTRPRLRSWEAHRRNGSLTVLVTLFGPPQMKKM